MPSPFVVQQDTLTQYVVTDLPQPLQVFFNPATVNGYPSFQTTQVAVVDAPYYWLVDRIRLWAPAWTTTGTTPNNPDPQFPYAAGNPGSTRGGLWPTSTPWTPVRFGLWRRNVLGTGLLDSTDEGMADVAEYPTPLVLQPGDALTAGWLLFRPLVGTLAVELTYRVAQRVG